MWESILSFLEQVWEIVAVKLSALFFFFLFFVNNLLIDCSPDPHFHTMEKDLGVPLPHTYEMLRNDACVIGFELETVFVFKYDQESFDSLKNAIENSLLYNYPIADSAITAKEDSIYALLANSGQIGWWYQTDSSYNFHVPLFDRTIIYSADKELGNYDNRIAKYIIYRTYLHKARRRLYYHYSEM